ncbi:MAG: septum site-determining protein MinC [Chloroflexi bacterium]|jgi:septum site-determining protein MinC|nr:septum site-determining protein MinC [Chloroflexota bacterium]
MDKAIQIKGTREGLTITLGASSMPDVLQDLGHQLRTQGAFFRGGAVALQATTRALTRDEIVAVRDLLADYDMTLRTIVTSNDVTRQAATQLDIKVVDAEPQRAVARAAPPREGREPTGPSTGDGMRGMLVKRVVRSGQTVRHAGHVVVIGDVNVGGEILAGGDIVVWGRLRGLAHAGCYGDEKALVCALELAPQQLRIAQHVARPAEGGRRAGDEPEVARVADGAIVVEPWDQARRQGAPR